MNTLLVLVLLDVWCVSEHSIQRFSQVLQFHDACAANVRVQHEIELIFSVEGLEAWELSEEFHCILHGQRVHIALADLAQFRVNERNITVEGFENIGADVIWLDVWMLFPRVLFEKTFNLCDSHFLLHLTVKLLEDCLGILVSHLIALKCSDCHDKFIKLDGVDPDRLFHVRLEPFVDARVSLAERLLQRCQLHVELNYDELVLLLLLADKRGESHEVDVGWLAGDAELSGDL